MKIAAAFLALAGVASAFTGTPTPSSKSALKMAVFDDYVGAVDFRGAEFKFDPVSILVKFLGTHDNVCKCLTDCFMPFVSSVQSFQDVRAIRALLP